MTHLPYLRYPDDAESYVVTAFHTGEKYGKIKELDHLNIPVCVSYTKIFIKIPNIDCF